MTFTAFKTVRTVRLVGRRQYNSQIINLFATTFTRVRTIKTYKSPGSQHQEIAVARQQPITLMTRETLYMPPVVTQLIGMPSGDGLFALDANGEFLRIPADHTVHTYRHLDKTALVTILPILATSNNSPTAQYRS